MVRIRVVLKPLLRHSEFATQGARVVFLVRESAAKKVSEGS